jgi:hypothetical protein
MPLSLKQLLRLSQPPLRVLLPPPQLRHLPLQPQGAPPLLSQLPLQLRRGARRCRRELGRQISVSMFQSHLRWRVAILVNGLLVCAGPNESTSDVCEA